MASLILPISDQLRAFADERAREQSYSDVAAYILSLIEDDRAKNEPLNIDPAFMTKFIAKGDESGEPVEITGDYAAMFERRMMTVIEEASNRNVSNSG